MDILELVLLVVLLVSAAIIIVAVLFQKSNEDGLSGSISGGPSTARISPLTATELFISGL